MVRACLGDDIRDGTWRDVDCPPVPTIYQRFIAAIRGEGPADPDFARGALLQRLLDLEIQRHEAAISAERKGMVGTGERSSNSGTASPGTKSARWTRISIVDGAIRTVTPRWAIPVIRPSRGPGPRRAPM